MLILIKQFLNMKVSLSLGYSNQLNEQVLYIAKDKPIAAKKFKKDLIFNLKKDLIQPYNYQKSKYDNDSNIRDYVFKGYTSVYDIN